MGKKFIPVREGEGQETEEASHVRWTKVSIRRLKQLLSATLGVVIFVLIIVIIIVIFGGLTWANTNSGGGSGNKNNGHNFDDVEVTLETIEELNFVLGLKFISSAAYNAITAASLTYTDFVTPDLNTIKGTYLQATFTTAGTQESSQATTLSAMINSLCQDLPFHLQASCAPVIPCTYNFGSITTPHVALLLMQSIESTNVRALITASTDPIIWENSAILLTGILSTTQAHATVYNLMLGSSVFPDTITPPLDERTVLCQQGNSYVTNQASCPPFNIVDPHTCP